MGHRLLTGASFARQVARVRVGEIDGPRAADLGDGRLRARLVAGARRSGLETT